MKKGKRLFAIFAFVMLGLFAFAFASVTTVYANVNTATYTVTSTSAVSTTGAPTGSSATYSSTYSSKCQLTGGNSMTLTLSGYAGNTIQGISLSMRSNSSSGAGSLSVTAGTTKIAEIEDSKFNSTNWNGAWSTSYVDITPTVTEYEVKENENIVIIIAASANSLYCQSFSITYEDGATIQAEQVTLNETSLSLSSGNTATLTATVTPENTTNKTIVWTTGDSSIATVDANGVVTAVSAGTTTITATVQNTTVSASCSVTVTQTPEVLLNFKDTNLQEQLAFHYDYAEEYHHVSTPVDGETYYVGVVTTNTVYAMSTTSYGAAIKSSSSIEFQVSHSDENYFYIIMGTKYLKSGSSTSLSTESETNAKADTSGAFLWTYDSENDIIRNKSTGRFLGFQDKNYASIKAYSPAGDNLTKYPHAYFIPTDGVVTFTDKASNTDAVTMRIGYTISKEMYNEILELDSNAEFGLYLNNTHYEACNPVEVDENTYRFYVAVNGITAANYTTVLTACAYVSVNNDIYYTTDVNEYSVKTLALEYITNHLDNEQVADAEYALRYLAYYA